MKYFVIDNYEEIKVIDRDSLKERSDIEYIHDLVYITDAKIADKDYFEINSNMVLTHGTIYHIVVVEYDMSDDISNSANLMSVIGIYDEITANKIASAIKDDLRKNPKSVDTFEIDDESINPIEWKCSICTPKKILSIPLKFKHGDIK